MTGDRLRILLVEDNEDHAELFRRAITLIRPDTDIYHAWDGDEALDFVHGRGRFTNSQSSPRPHLILLDLRLPKMDGLDVLKDIRTAPGLRNIPIIVVSSSDSPNDVSEALNAHANSYVMKPSDFEELETLVRDLGAYWLKWDLGVNAK
jgi:CheY-like chemotaxis protein